MKFGQLIEYNTNSISFKKYAENETGRLALSLLLYPQKALYKVKPSGQHLSFNMYW